MDTSQPPLPPASEPTPPVELHVRLREGTRVRVTLELLDETGVATQSGAVELNAPTEAGYEETILFRDAVPVPPVTSQETPTQPPPLPFKATWPKWSLPTVLFGATLAIYLLVRFIGLQAYPIYFFSDEAISTVMASGLVSNNFDYEGTFLPTYFKNDRKFSLSATVYLSLLPYLMLGKSILVVRGLTVLISLLAAVCLALILKQFLVLPYWWSAGLLLSIVPAWFLHSRTGFETAMAGSFYAAFLYVYLRYRMEHPRHLYLALFLGALTFYTYAPAQMVMVGTGLGLLISDWRYHREHRNVSLRGVGLLALFFLPYVRFQLTHPGATADNLQESSSYWIGAYTLPEKLGLFFKEYLTGLSPTYWYFPNHIDIPRHIMDGHGNILWITLPFALLGVFLAVRGFRTAPRGPVWRTILIALLASPLGAAVAMLGVTRALFFVIPATLLTALGLIQCLEWLQARGLSGYKLAVGTFVVLALGNLAMLTDALINGPFWYTDYSRGGMQYGARQVFREIQALLKEAPDTQIVLSPDWANGTHTLIAFFLGKPPNVRLDSFIPYTYKKREIAPNTIFVVSFSEFLVVSESGKFNLEAIRTIEDPNGHPAFLFLRASYVDYIDEIFARELVVRHQLLDDTAYFEGTPIPVRHSRLDMGEIGHVFDGNPDTLARTDNVNPFVIEFSLSEARPVNGVALNIGAALVQVKVTVYPELNAEPVTFSQELEGFIDRPEVELLFGQTVAGQMIRIEILDKRQNDPGHVHLWEIRLR